MNAIDKQTEQAPVMRPVPLSPEALRALEERVVATIDQRRDTRDVNKLHESSLTFGQRVADRVASTMGSWPFIIVKCILLTCWIGLNVSELITRAWDPYPFILLNLMLSFQAAYAAPFIMMSQSRHFAKDRLAAELDLQTNLRAEALIEDLHGAMKTLRRHEDLLDVQQCQIELMQTLLRRVPVATPAPERGRPVGHSPRHSKHSE